MSDLSNDASSPAGRREMHSVSIHALGARCRIQFRCADQAAARKLMGAAAAWLGAFERKCSLLTAAADCGGVRTDPETEQVLKAADTASILTGGISLSFDLLSRQYAVDRLVQLLRQQGIRDALIQAGSDLFALGSDGENPFWKVGAEQGIQTPDGAVLMLSNEAVSCASRDDCGVNSRKRPATEQDLHAVTVVASNCLTAGVHAASMLVLGSSEGLRFAESSGMADACLLNEGGAAVTTRGFSKYLALSEGDDSALADAQEPVLVAQPKAVTKWLGRDLIRLWPWLLPVVLLLITFGPAGFRHTGTQPEAAGAALGMVWMTYFITRRLWGHYRAHVAATMLMFTLGLFAVGWLPMPDLTLCFLNLAAIAVLVHRHAGGFFALLGLGFLVKGPVAALVPASAALGWWLAGGRRERWWCLPGTGIVLVAGVAALVFKTAPGTTLAPTAAANVLEGSWWRFLPMLFLALMPWSFCTPRVIRQGWRRLRTGTLQARHGLLAGWSLPALALTPGGLTASALILVPALVIALCPPLADARRLWRIGTASLALWLASGLVLNLSHGNGAAPSAPQTVLEAPLPAGPHLTVQNRTVSIAHTSATSLHR